MSALSIGSRIPRRSSKPSSRPWRPACQKDSASRSTPQTVICIWEGPSVDEVRDLVESVVGPYSRNEYHEVELESFAA